MRELARRAVIVGGTLALLAASGGPASARADRVAGRAATAAGAGSSTAGTGRTAAGAGQGNNALLPAGHEWTVTLVTGDVVGVRTVAGMPPQVTVRPGTGRQRVVFTKLVDSAGRIVVIPHDVEPLIRKVIDPALFDVTTLIDNGDDDAHRSAIPLIVQGLNGVTGSAAALALSPSPGQSPAATPAIGVALPSINSVAVSVPKAGAAAEGSLLGGLAAAMMRPARAASPAASKVRYIWLDRTVRAGDPAPAAAATAKVGQLDANLTQIGAPAAWQAGDTGRGVTVAVLDTGVDATHPDLRGQIAAEKNFSASPDMTDRVGHGTFVAAQVAGSGAAAAGERRGVAFGAKLAIGKVLGDDGTGDDSAVIAGMQWAAPQARVVSMSLGSSGPADGTDPVSEAVDNLTAADHALFVIAAGNDGPDDQSLDSPGAATGALTVGAVDAQDNLAGFSSRGPRPGDNAIKPEIVAPGVNIVGARAAGTTAGPPLNGQYVTLSGTSMATPQVAGAAAILAQLHPDWRPPQLRAALVSTAHPAHGGDIFELGAGRLDIAAAIADPVAASDDVANLGTLTPDMSKSQVLTWTNYSKTSVRLALSAALTDHAGNAAPASSVSVSPASLDIPAGGSASAMLRVDAGPLAAHPGLYEGMVTGQDGGPTVHLPVGLFLPPPTHALTLRATPLPGTAAGAMSAAATIVSLTDMDLFPTISVQLGPDSTTTVQVPDGHYWILGEVDDNTNPALPRSALTGQPEVIVNSDTTVTLDAAAAVPATSSVTGHATEMADPDIHVERTIGGTSFGADFVSFGAPTSQPVLYGQPSAAAQTGTYQVYTDMRLISPATAAGGLVYDLFHLFGDRVPASLTYTVTPTKQASLAEIEQRFFAVDGTITPLLESRAGFTASGFFVQNETDGIPAASTRTDFVSTEAGISWSDEVSPPILVAGKPQSGPWVIIGKVVHYVPGSRQTADWAREPFRPGPYSDTVPSASFCAPTATTRSRGNIAVDLVDLQDMPDGFDCLDPFPGSTLRLFRDGTLVGTAQSPVANFTVPETSAEYQLSYDNNTSSALPVSTQTHTTWTFSSPEPSGLSQTRIPLLTVDYQLPLGLDNHPDGAAAVLTIGRVAGTPDARVNQVQVWTSVNDGKTWQSATVNALGGDKYGFTLPHADAGEAVTLRVRAADAGGSGIDQTMISAYHA